MAAVEEHSEVVNCCCEEENLAKLLSVGVTIDQTTTINKCCSLKVLNLITSKLLENKIKYVQRDQPKEESAKDEGTLEDETQEPDEVIDGGEKEEENKGGIKIIVKTVGGKKMPINIEAEFTVKEIKETI